MAVGCYTVTVVVSDGNGGLAAHDFSVTVMPNLPPVAIATSDKTIVTVGEEVCFDGSQSYDPEEGPLDYMWDFGDGSLFGVGVVLRFVTCTRFLARLRSRYASLTSKKPRILTSLR
jgi:PKD repeat protein